MIEAAKELEISVRNSADCWKKVSQADPKVIPLKLTHE